MSTVRRWAGALAAGTAAVVVAVGLGGCSTSGPGPWPDAVAAPTTGSSVPAADAAAARAGAPGAKGRPAKRRVTPRSKPKPVNHCAHNSAAQKVIVSIRHQHAWMCAHHTAVLNTGVTTGMAGPDTSTPTGNYEIQGRDRNTVLTLNTGATYDVKYWIPFSAPLYGFHDSSWQHFPYGSAKYKTAGSHGCVHMPLKAMKFLYSWSADRTTLVHIA